MPIKPENKALYPANWATEIRPTILARAQNRCEECGVPNGWLITRDADGTWHDAGCAGIATSKTHDRLFNGQKVIRVVLTIARLDHNPRNNDPSNLKALCQLHHNRYDAAPRANCIGA